MQNALAAVSLLALSDNVKDDETLKLHGASSQLSSILVSGGLF